MNNKSTPQGQTTRKTDASVDKPSARIVETKPGNTKKD